MIGVSPVSMSNLLSPMVLFFVLGVAAALARSDLTVPREVTAGVALYLMMAVGFRGGVELAHSGLSAAALKAAACGMLLGLLLPCIAFALLRRLGRLDPINAGAIAAHYGSISAVTFVTATSFLQQLGVPFGGYMVAVMALMEAPGIVVGILLARLAVAREAGPTAHGAGSGALSAVVRETLLGGSVLLLLGSFAIGLLTRERGMAFLKPFAVDLFPGALALFLLDMGLTAARRLREFMQLGRFLVAFGLSMPLIGGILGILMARLAGLGVGEAVLLATLSASASYIAAPAAVRLALPEANPSLAITLSLGVTFPFNVLVGIPLYHGLAQALVGR